MIGVGGPSVSKSPPALKPKPLFSSLRDPSTTTYALVCCIRVDFAAPYPQRVMSTFRGPKSMSTFFPTSHSFGTTSPPKPRDHDLTTVYLNAQPIASSTGGGGGGGGCGFGGGDGGVHRAHVLHLHFMHDFWVEQKGSHASYLKSLSSPESQAFAPSGSGGGICVRASRVA